MSFLKENKVKIEKAIKVGQKLATELREQSKSDNDQIARDLADAVEYLVKTKGKATGSNMRVEKLKMEYRSHLKHADQIKFMSGSGVGGRIAEIQELLGRRG